MFTYTKPLDIANRALQHLGATRIDNTLGFDEASLNASETEFAYDKLREAELATGVWRFAIQKVILRPIDTTTMIVSPIVWDAATIYFVGHIVVDPDGQNYWESKVPNNLGNDPRESPAWEQYFGPLTVMPYDPKTTYFSGELVYTTEGNGINRVYRSLRNSNADNPETPLVWDPTVTYFKNDIVTVVGGIPPRLILEDGLGFLLLEGGGVLIGETGVNSPAIMSRIDLNINQDPIHTGTWTTTFVGGITSLKWRQIGGPEFPSGVNLVTPNIIYPLGTGPVSQSPQRFIYQLPANYLREAPRDPKAGSASYLGSPTNLQYTDWNLESNYIVTRDVEPLMFRFVANITNVRQMTPLFREYLAARLAMETCQRITQSDTKLQGISNIYQHHKGLAKIANGIETGATEPPLDDYIATRL